MSRIDRDIKRDIQRKVKESKKPVEEWRTEHAEEIRSVIGKNMSEDTNVGMIKAKKRFFNYILGTVGILFIIIAVVVALLINGQQQSIQPGLPDLTFGEESVEAIQMSDEELMEVKEQHYQLNLLENTDGAKFIYQMDNSVVMTLVNGELETADDFYFVDARISYNDNFIFLDKWEYEELESEVVIGSTVVRYEARGMDDFGLYLFFAVTETESETVYWRVSCMEGLFDEWLSIMFE